MIFLSVSWSSSSRPMGLYDNIPFVTISIMGLWKLKYSLLFSAEC